MKSKNFRLHTETEKPALRAARLMQSYAWAYQDGSTTRYVAVLEIPPVESPQTALRAAIVSKTQK